MANTSSTEQADAGSTHEETCPLCKGLGYVRADVPVGQPDFGRLIPCTCQLEELAQRRVTALRTLSDLEIVAQKTFETFVPDGHGLPPDKQANLRQAYEAARSFAGNPEGWLILKGGYGCGKTHLAAAIANQCAENGRPVLFITTPDLLDHLRAAFAPASPATYDARFEEVRTAPVLVLDDLGTESPTPWAQEKLFQILNHRYNARLPTVITTNHELEEISLRLRSRLVDPDLARIVSITAPDFRQAGIASDQSDLSSRRLHSEQTFRSFDLRKGEQLPPEEEENLKRAFDVSRGFADDPGNWLALLGAHGCGKTHLAAAIANHRAAQGHPVLFVFVPDLLDHLRATFNPHSAVTFDQRFEEVRRAPLLVLDDLGTESATPWAREKLYQILNYRYNARLPTVITTARKLDDVDPYMRARMLDESRCTIFEILTPPYRGGPARRRKGASRSA